MLCLEVLVSLAPHEEELGKNEYSEVNNLRSRVLVKPVADGGLTLDSVFRVHFCCRQKPRDLLFQVTKVPSTFSEDQTRRAGKHWVWDGLNISCDLVTC